MDAMEVRPDLLQKFGLANLLRAACASAADVIIELY